MSTEQLFLILQFCFGSDSILFWQPALHGPPLVPPSWCLTGDSDCILSGEQSSNNQLYLVDGWATPLKNRISSIGMISNPIYIYTWSLWAPRFRSVIQISRWNLKITKSAIERVFAKFGSNSKKRVCICKTPLLLTRKPLFPCRGQIFATFMAAACGDAWRPRF